ncbi:MAG: tetratricopeptide repeat protein [Flammeovirgaceae bacterium]
MHQLLQAHEIYESLGNNHKLAENLNQIGLVYIKIKQPDLAMKSFESALAIYQQEKDTLGIAYSYGCVGRIFEKRNDYRQAIHYQEMALKLYEAKGDKRGMAIIFENIGSIYEDRQDFPLALDYFKKSLMLNELTHDSISMIGSINNIGDNYRKTGNYSMAEQWTRKSLVIATRLNDKYQSTSAYKDLSKLYALSGKYEQAYQNLEIGRNLYEEMYDRDASKQLQLFQTLFEIERKNYAIKNLEADQKFNYVFRIGLLIGLILVVLLGVVVISRQRLKIQQNNLIFEARNKLLQAEIENTRLHEQQLQRELEVKAKSLTAHTLNIISKNKILEDIQGSLHELLKSDSPDYRKSMKKLVKMIEHNFVQDKDWDDFRSIFEQVHQDFFNKLMAVSQDLTAADTRLASLIRLQIPSKDIAVILGISQDSLRISRYRLRKKLQLTQGDSLSNFMLNL